MREVDRLAHLHDRDVSSKRRVVEGQDGASGGVTRLSPFAFWRCCEHQMDNF
jgi:hypothetical protein